MRIYFDGDQYWEPKKNWFTSQINVKSVLYSLKVAYT